MASAQSRTRRTRLPVPSVKATSVPCGPRSSSAASQVARPRPRYTSRAGSERASPAPRRPNGACQKPASETHKSPAPRLWGTLVGCGQSYILVRQSALSQNGTLLFINGFDQFTASFDHYDHRCGLLLTTRARLHLTRRAGTSVTPATTSPARSFRSALEPGRTHSTTCSPNPFRPRRTPIPAIPPAEGGSSADEAARREARPAGSVEARSVAAARSAMRRSRRRSASRCRAACASVSWAGGSAGAARSVTRSEPGAATQSWPLRVTCRLRCFRQHEGVPCGDRIMWEHLTPESNSYMTSKSYHPWVCARTHTTEKRVTGWTNTPSTATGSDERPFLLTR